VNPAARSHQSGPSLLTGFQEQPRWNACAVTAEQNCSNQRRGNDSSIPSIGKQPTLGARPKHRPVRRPNHGVKKMNRLQFQAQRSISSAAQFLSIPAAFAFMTVGPCRVRSKRDANADLPTGHRTHSGPNGGDIKHTAHLYVFVPMFSSDKDTNPNDAMPSPNGDQPG
jgi:hypothetical protein